MKKKNDGFTLAELLVVVAIIEEHAENSCH